MIVLHRPYIVLSVFLTIHVVDEDDQVLLPLPFSILFDRLMTPLLLVASPPMLRRRVCRLRDVVAEYHILTGFGQTLLEYYIPIALLESETSPLPLVGW